MRFLRREPTQNPGSTWADRRDRIRAGVRALPQLPWALRIIVDGEGKDSGFAFVRGRVPDADRTVFEEIASSHRLIGLMEWWGFPRPELSWGGESYAAHSGEAGDDPFDLPEVAACEAWAHRVRDPDAYLPPGRPRFEFSNLDFVDVVRARRAAFGASEETVVPKRWDVVCAVGETRHAELVADWSLGRRCIEVLAGELGLSVLILGRAGVPDVPALPGVEVRAPISWSERLGCLARSRLTLVPDHLEPAPRVVPESLAVGAPVLVNAHILGGWHLVNGETGAFFDGPADVGPEALRCLASEHRTVQWVERSGGPDGAAEALAAELRQLGDADQLDYAVPSSLFR